VNPPETQTDNPQPLQEAATEHPVGSPAGSGDQSIPTIKIVYDLLDEDVINYSIYFTDHSKYMKSLRGAQQYRIPIYFLLAGLMFGWVNDSSIWPLTAVALALLWVLWYPFAARSSTRKIFNRMYDKEDNQGVTGRWEISASEDGIARMSIYESTRMRWQLFKRIDITPHYLFLTIGASNAIVIPRGRILDGDFDTFTEYCRKRIVEQGGAVHYEA